MKEQYKLVIEDGGSIDYKKISLCDLKSHLKRLNNYRPLYQVHSDNPKFRFSEVYRDLDEALNKFFDIRTVVDKGGY